MTNSQSNLAFQVLKGAMRASSKRTGSIRARASMRRSQKKSTSSSVAEASPVPEDEDEGNKN